MTLTYVLLQNLRRNRLRTGLTALAFALPMGLFVAAISMVVGLREAGAASEKELRLAVTNRVTLVNLLPEGLRRRIEALDESRGRITAVCGMRWFGGHRPNSPNVVTSLAADVDTFHVVYSDIGMTPAEVERWQTERRAAVVGIGLAREFRCEVGGKITLQSSIPPYLPLEFTVVKIMEEDSRAGLLYFRRDYLEEAMKAAGAPAPGCHIFWVKCSSLRAMESLQPEIDAAFANTPDETLTQSENAFVQNFFKSMGDLPALIMAISLVVVIVITLIGGNTVMMSFRERQSELAVFKAVGFRARRVFFIVLGESILLALFGSLLGIVPVSVTLSLIPHGMMALGPMGALSISPWGIIGAVLLALMIGAAAGLWPAYQALRLRTVDALRTAG